MSIAITHGDFSKPVNDARLIMHIELNVKFGTMSKLPVINVYNNLYCIVLNVSRKNTTYFKIKFGMDANLQLALNTVMYCYDADKLKSASLHVCGRREYLVMVVE